MTGPRRQAREAALQILYFWEVGRAAARDDLGVAGRRSLKPVTRSRWRSELTGPSVVSGAIVSPITYVCASEPTPATTSSVTRLEASTRVAAVQSWPALK